MHCFFAARWAFLSLRWASHCEQKTKLPDATFDSTSNTAQPINRHQQDDIRCEFKHKKGILTCHHVDPLGFGKVTKACAKLWTDAREGRNWWGWQDVMGWCLWDSRRSLDGWQQPSTLAREVSQKQKECSHEHRCTVTDTTTLCSSWMRACAPTWFDHTEATIMYSVELSSIGRVMLHSIMGCLKTMLIPVINTPEILIEHLQWTRPRSWAHGCLIQCVLHWRWHSNGHLHCVHCSAADRAISSSAAWWSYCATVLGHWTNPPGEPGAQNVRRCSGVYKGIQSEYPIVTQIILWHSII
jgi:hypothetical protein